MVTRSDAARRLVVARGHLDAVIRMVDDQRYCIDVLHQLSAVQGALERARRELIAGHLRGCVPEAIRTGHTDDIVEELLTALFGGAPRGAGSTPVRRRASTPPDDARAAGPDGSAPAHPEGAPSEP